MNKAVAKRLFDVSVLILLFLSICLCFTKIGFLLGGSVNGHLFIVYLLIAILVFCIFSIENNIEKMTSILFFILVLVGSIALNIKVFDMSYDGSAYQEMAIGLLANGWNPTRMSAEEFVSLSDLELMGKIHDIWIDHYANGTWTIASVIYAFTGYIEGGKAINILSIIAIFGILNYYVQKWKRCSFFSYVISFLASVNPITLGQIFTNYVDGMLMLYLELGILAWFIILKENDKRDKKIGFALLSCSIVFCANIKFTALFFIGIYTIVVYIIILLRAFKENRLKKVFVKLTSLLAAMVILSVGVIGYSPYVTNCINEGNPLYPLIGKGKVDIMTDNQPDSFLRLNSIEKLGISLFSQVDNINANVDRKPQLKIPFSVSIEEIKQCSVDTRVAGFGPWFGEIIVISGIVLSVNFGKRIRKKQEINVYYVALLMLSVVLMLFFTGNWWARYSAYEYFIVLAVLFIMEFRKGRIAEKIFNVVFCLMLFVNTMFFLHGNIEAVQNSKYIRTTMENLANVSESFVVELNLVNEDLSGAQFNLKDYGIDYSISNEYFSADGIYCGYTYRIKER